MGLSPTVGIGSAGVGGAGVGSAGISEAGGGPTPYVGPLDLVPGATWLWGASTVRALSASMLGENGYTLKREDEAELAFAYDSETGLIDLAAASTWGGEFPQVVLLNDHVGSNSLATNTGIVGWFREEPTFDNKPLLYEGVGGDDLAKLDASISLVSGGCTVFVVCSAFGGGPSFYLANAGDTAFVQFSPGTSGFKIDDSTGVPSRVAGATFSSGVTDLGILELSWEYGSRTALFNGVAVEIDAVEDAEGAPVDLPTLTGIIMFPGAGGFAEGFIADGVISSGDRATIRAELAAFWGVTLP